MSVGAVDLLVALQHGDSQFPSGGFAFSQGLEASSQLTEQLGPFDFAGFMAAQLRHRWAESDRVALVRAYRLGRDLKAVAELDREVEASTIVEGLRIGSRRNGAALLTAHAHIGTPNAKAYRAMLREGSAGGHLAVVQGLLWWSLDLSEETAVAISGYQAAASLATAAVRLGLIGALQAQAEISRMLPLLATLAAGDIADDAPIRSFIPLAEIAITKHGSSGQRLFSN